MVLRLLYLVHSETDKHLNHMERRELGEGTT
jgi:hypothetical protein